MSLTTIYYFSATGNSLVIAREIAAKLGDAEIISMAPERPMTHSKAKNIGLVFPVLMFGLPRIVTRFINTLEAPADSFIFAVATCGGTPFETLTEAAGLFSKRGMTLHAGFSVPMVNNCTTVGEAIPPDKQQKRLEKAMQSVNRICADITGRKRSLYKGIPILNQIFSSLHKSAIPKIAGAARYFYADKNCNGCSVCEKVCPMKNIIIEHDKPAWQDHCEQCYACLQWCPKESIQVTGKKTIGRRRYHHPAIRFSEIARKSISHQHDSTSELKLQNLNKE